MPAIMKMTTEHYTALERALLDTLVAEGLHRHHVQNGSHAWDCFHKACEDGRVDSKALYRDYTDEHIETAFRKIFRRRPLTSRR